MAEDGPEADWPLAGEAITKADVPQTTQRGRS